MTTTHTPRERAAEVMAVWSRTKIMYDEDLGAQLDMEFEGNRFIVLLDDIAQLRPVIAAAVGQLRDEGPVMIALCTDMLVRPESLSVYDRTEALVVTVMDDAGKHATVLRPYHRDADKMIVLGEPVTIENPNVSPVTMAIREGLGL